MDYTNYLQSILVLALVISLILGLSWIARRTGFGIAGGRPSGRRRRRLMLVESLALDGKRRLMLIRRDDREHLILVGGGTDQLIEKDIVPADPAEDPTT